MGLNKILKISTVLFFCSVEAFNVETENAKYVPNPNFNLSARSPDYFGYSLDLSVANASQHRVLVLIGAPKANQSSDAAFATAPTLQAQYNEITSVGDLFSCPLVFDNPDQNCTQARPPPVDKKRFPLTIANRDAIGLHITKEKDPVDPLAADIQVCTPNEGLECPESYLTLGNCYNSPDNGLTWNENSTRLDIDCPETIDLIFLLDGSFSISESNFQLILSWVANVSLDFASRDNVYIGVIQYSQARYTPSGFPFPSFLQFQQTTEIQLGQYQDHASFQAALGGITQHGSSTFTAYALNKTASDFMASPRYRFPSNRKIAVLLTDGASTDGEALPVTSSYVRSLGITFYAVGVAQYNETELLTITGTSVADENNTQVFGLTNFTDLDTIVDSLQESIAAQIEGSSTNGTNELQQAQLGFSAEKLRTGALYLGAVGAYDWSGTIVKYDSASDPTPDIPNFEQVQNVLRDNTKESYLGYAITSGFFNGRNDEFVAIGAPRYNLKGAVVIYEPQVNNVEFTNAATIYPNPQNSQLGSYFGGSLLAIDLNGDGYDDLLVGAPLYNRGGANYDDGRVYVYIARANGINHRLWASRGNPPRGLFAILSPETKSTGGRFGTAIASAGDLNADNYNDVIVGAPYANDNRGAVYVFHGTADGIDTEYKQIIKASELPNTYLRYFGLSLQGGQDLDKNGYPDIAVGAPKSDTVVIFRSRPVATFRGVLNFDRASVNVFDCLTSSNRDCLVLTACLTVTGTNIEPFVDVDYGLDLDSGISGGASKRVEFRQSGSNLGAYVINGTRNVSTERQDCWNTTVLVKQTIPDHTAPIEAVLTYKFSQSHQQRSLSSVRDPTVTNQASAMSEFSRDCGDDNVCKYNLGVDAKLELPSATLNGEDITDDGKTLIISQETDNLPITVKVNLTNSGDSAYEVKVAVNFTTQLSWTNLGRFQSSTSRRSYPCVVDAETDINGDTWRVKILNYRLNLNLINILPEESWCYFEFNLSSSSLRASGLVPDMRVSVTAGTGKDLSVSDDTDPSNNNFTGSAPIRYRADATAQERSLDVPLPFNFTEGNVTINSVNGIGMNLSNLQLTFEVNGRGHSTIPSSRISYSFPYRLPNTTNDDMMHLLYLYRYSCETPAGSASCVCDESLVNPYNLLDRFPTENDTNLNNITISSNPNQIIQSTVYDCSENGNEAPGTCATLRCNISGLPATGNIVFRVYLRFWARSFNLVNDSLATLRSEFRYSTEDSPLLINSLGQNAIVSTATNNIIARLFVPPDVIIATNDIWIYIVAAIGGLLLLIIIIIVLWKTGFFKSKYAEKKEQLEWTDAQASGGSNVDAASTADIVGS